MIFLFRVVGLVLNAGLVGLLIVAFVVLAMTGAIPQELWREPLQRAVTLLTKTAGMSSGNSAGPIPFAGRPAPPRIPDEPTAEPPPAAVIGRGGADLSHSAGPAPRAAPSVGPDVVTDVLQALDLLGRIDAGPPGLAPEGDGK